MGIGENNFREKSKLSRCITITRIRGSNGHEDNCHNVAKFGPKNRLMFILFVIYFTGIIWELDDEHKY